MPEQFSLEQIDALRQSDPARYWEYIRRLSAVVSRDDAQENLNQALIVRAQSGCSVAAFDAFYELIHGNRLLKTNHREAEKVFGAHETGEIYLYQGFRGVRKTTTFIITLGAFLHGYFPEMTGVITGAADPNAKLLAKSIAQIIEQHPMWPRIFPHVVPYKDRGWGAEGYWVRRTHKRRLDADGREVVDGEGNYVFDELTIGEWTAMQAKVNDPSFVGGGYRSAEINGKHPSLYLFVDDLHDIDSSQSPTEREYIKTVFLTQILNTVLREHDKLLTWVVMTGVPFAKDDTYAVLRDSGGVVYSKVPVMTRAPDGAEGAVYLDGVNLKTGVVYQDIVGWWYLAEPTVMGPKSIVDWRSKGKSQFWQMYMMDIQTAKTAGLTYYLYPHDQIPFTLPTGGGADPTSIDPDYEVGGQKRSAFALAYVCKLTDGRLVLKSGVLKEMGILKAKEAMLQAQSVFTNWKGTKVEGVGPGKIFQQYLRTDPNVLWTDSNIADPQGRVRDKKARFEGEISPWLDAGVLLISDDENDAYCMAVRYLCDNFFDIDPHRPHESLDAGDGLYHALKHFPEVLRTPTTPRNMSPQAMAANQRGGLFHPLANIGR